jgi:hypothetical protein
MDSIALTEEKIKLVVINEHTLGYMIPGHEMAGILRTSVLRGSFLNPNHNVMTKGAKVRLASAQDFDDFGVVFKGYQNPEKYEYDPTPMVRS